MILQYSWCCLGTIWIFGVSNQNYAYLGFLFLFLFFVCMISASECSYGRPHTHSNSLVWLGSSLFLQKSIFAVCRTPWITTSEVAVIVQDTIYMYVEFPSCCLFNFVGVFNFAQWNAALACARNWWAVGRRFAGLEKEEKKLSVFFFFYSPRTCTQANVHSDARR